jgi:hypothetical protein
MCCGKTILGTAIAIQMIFPKRFKKLILNLKEYGVNPTCMIGVLDLVK